MPPRRFDLLLDAARPLLHRDQRPDAELLARFLDDRDELAFEVLLLRHTPAVRAAARTWLRSPADLDDAAQATFLVLVQRAQSIRNRAALGRWLYGVAANVARRLHQKQQRRADAALRTGLEEVPGREQDGDEGLRDLLAEEVARLPEKYRLPVQLCYCAGLSTAEAAERLGWPKGTVLTRLAWARRHLQRCLTRRGVTPAVFGGLVATMAAPAGEVSGSAGKAWVRGMAQVARRALAGESLDTVGVSEQTIALSKGVVRAMFHDRLKFVALAVLLAVGLTGLSLHRWATASDGPGKDRRAAVEVSGDHSKPFNEWGNPVKEPAPPQAAPGAQPPDGRPAAGGRRREAVIRLPVGTFVKEVDVPPYGTGRLTWTYEEERVLGLIEASVMGFEVELATEAEYSLSSTGTIYGVITGARLNHVKLPDWGKEFEELRPFLGLWSAVEPLFNDVIVDLPFSYRCRVQEDRLVISNFRILLAGPNPLGKLGPLGAELTGKEIGVALAFCSAVGTAFEGTYMASDAREKAPLGKRPLFLKPTKGSERKLSPPKSH